jgi:glycosyltransferase involved in cell wall biosynthesis
MFHGSAVSLYQNIQIMSKKLIVIFRGFSGLGVLEPNGEWKNYGSPAYYNFIRRLDERGDIDYCIFLLQSDISDVNKIRKFNLKNLSCEVINIPYHSLYFRETFKVVKKIEFFYNKLIQYIQVIRLTKYNHNYYIDRDNILLSNLLLILNRKSKVVVRLLGVTKSLYRHLTVRNSIYSRFIKWGFENSRSNFICTNDGSYAELISKKFNPLNFYLFFNGVDKTMRQLPLLSLSKKKRIVYLSRVTENKGHADFINAIYKSRSSPFLEVIIIGDGSFLKDLKELVFNLRLGNCISFTGRLSHSNAMNELKKAHLLMSLNYDGLFGNGVIEAAQMGIPIITLAHPGCVTDKLSYFKVLPRKDVINSAADAINEFCTKKSTRISMSQNSRYFSDKNLVSWNDRIDDEIKILSSIYNLKN